MFHMIRRQMLRPFRKPLIVMTPKSLLRHKSSVSSLSDLSNGRFHLVIPDESPIDKDKVTRVVFCSGKVYYDLAESRQQHNIADTAIIRIEQLYPFPISEYATAIAQYPNAVDFVWCQEEPKNQGSWYQVRHRLQAPLTDEQQLFYAGRRSAAAPASGVFKLHLQQQQALVEAALNISTHARNSRGHAQPDGKPNDH